MGDISTVQGGIGNVVGGEGRGGGSPWEPRALSLIPGLPCPARLGTPDCAPKPNQTKLYVRISRGLGGARLPLRARGHPTRQKRSLSSRALSDLGCLGQVTLPGSTRRFASLCSCTTQVRALGAPHLPLKWHHTEGKARGLGREVGGPPAGMGAEGVGLGARTRTHHFCT